MAWNSSGPVVELPYSAILGKKEAAEGIKTSLALETAAFLLQTRTRNAISST